MKTMQTMDKTTTTTTTTTTTKAVILLMLGAVVFVATTVHCQDANNDYEIPANIPYYMQSPIANNMVSQQQQLINISEAQQQPQITQRQTIPVIPITNINEISQQQQQQQQQQLPSPEIQTNTLRNNAGQQQQQQPTTSGCLYDKSYFAKFDDECLARKPYPTIGLPAYKNEDLLIKRGLSERHGCVFILSNGLFKNYHLTRYSVDSDSQCLDGGKVQLSMQFSNVSLYYLWTLRCLNYADQLLSDATLNGKTILSNGNNKMSDDKGSGKSHGGICVGSSQNFGFTSLQLTNIEAQVELATDIYKNMRITNVTVAMLNNYSPNGQSSSSTLRSLNQPEQQQLNHVEQQTPPPPQPPSQLPLTHVNPLMGTAIKDFTFESLDSDELNWRYMHLFQNWARNRMHTNFLEQYKRFLWLSMQRCLSESSERLPVKLVDLFANHKYN